MRKIKLLILLSLLIMIFIVILFVGFSSNVTKKTESEIAEEILKLTPIGSELGYVCKKIDNNNMFEWNGYVNRSHGFIKDTSESEVGKQSICAEIKSFSILFKKSVVVYWGFDEESKLIDVCIKKQTSGF